MIIYSRVDILRFVDYAGVVFGLRQIQPHGGHWGYGVSCQGNENVT